MSEFFNPFVLPINAYINKNLMQRRSFDIIIFNRLNTE